MRWRVGDLDAVAKCDALDDFGQLFFALQPVPGLGCGHHQLERHQPGGVLRQRALGADGAMSDRDEHALDRVGRARMGAPSAVPKIPSLSREVVEGQQRVLVVHQAGDRFRVLGPIFLPKHRNGINQR